MPNLYIIAGCNGAGKTTASYTILPEMLNCEEFVNADSIAAGLSPFNPESVAIEASRIMLKRIDSLLHRKEDFAIETTLSTKSYVALIEKARMFDYKIILIYFWLSSPQIAKQRVASRVNKGGHNIPDHIIERRYFRGYSNLYRLYLPVCDFWIIVTTDIGKPGLISSRESNQSKVPYNVDVKMDSQIKIIEIKPENIELRNKILEGVNNAFKKLVIASAKKNEKLVIADKDGNVLHVPAKDLLKTFSDTEKI